MTDNPQSHMSTMKHLHGFTCPDCGQRILSYSWDDEDQRCASCDWIRINIPSEQQADVRDRLGVPLRVRDE